MIDFGLSDEQTQMQTMASSFLRNNGPVDRLRAPSLAQPESELIAGLIELGLVGISVPEAMQGQGLTLADECLVQREFGEQIAPVELLAAALGAIAASQAGDAGLAGSFSRGEVRILLALPAASEELIVTGPPGNALILSWRPDGGEIWDGNRLAPAVAADGWDVGTIFHRVRVEGATPVARFDGWTFAAIADTILAAQLSGIAERTCRSAVDYALVREQFGRAIGSFQAIKHRCADMKLAAAQAWAQTVAAAVAVDDRLEGFADAAAMAKLVAARAALQNARSNIQIHGGMGFTEECDAHLFLKRSHLLDQLGGNVRDQKRRIGGRLGGQGEATVAMTA